MAKTPQIITRTVLLLLVLQSISGDDRMEVGVDVENEPAVEPPRLDIPAEPADASLFFHVADAEHSFAWELEELAGDASPAGQDDEDDALVEQLRRESQRMALSLEGTADSSCVLKVLGFYMDYLDRQHDAEYQGSGGGGGGGGIGNDSGYDSGCDSDAGRDRGSCDSGDGNAGGGHGIGDDVAGDSALDRDGLVKLIAVELTQCLFASDGAMRRLGPACEGVCEHARRRRGPGTSAAAGTVAKQVNRCVASLSNDMALWTTFNGYLGQVDTMLHRHFVQLDNVRLLSGYKQVLAGQERTLDSLVVRLVRLARLFSETVPAAAAAAASASASVAASVAASPVAPGNAAGAAGASARLPYGQARTIFRRCRRLLFVCVLPAVAVGFAGAVFGRALANRQHGARGTRRAPPPARCGWGLRTIGTATPTKTMTISMGGVQPDREEVLGEQAASGGNMVDAAAVGTESFERAVLERAIALLVGAGCCYAVLHADEHPGSAGGR